MIFLDLRIIKFNGVPCALIGLDSYVPGSTVSIDCIVFCLVPTKSSCSAFKRDGKGVKVDEIRGKWVVLEPDGNLKLGARGYWPWLKEKCTFGTNPAVWNICEIANIIMCKIWASEIFIVCAGWKTSSETLSNFLAIPFSTSWAYLLILFGLQSLAYVPPSPLRASLLEASLLFQPRIALFQALWVKNHKLVVYKDQNSN
jgi:hypothetical protein